MNNGIKYSLSLIATVALLSSCDSYKYGSGYQGDLTPLSSPHGAIIDGEESLTSVIDEEKWEMAARDMVAEFITSAELLGVNISIEPEKTRINYPTKIFDNYLRKTMIGAGYNVVEESDYRVIYNVKETRSRSEVIDGNLEISMILVIDEERVVTIKEKYSIDIE